MNKIINKNTANKKAKQNRWITFVTALFMVVCVAQQASAQFKCVINGSVSEGKRKMDLAVVTLYKGKAVVQQISTNSSGKFNFNLEPSSEYSIVITRPGYITKKIMYSTMGISVETAKNFSKTFYPEVDLFELPKDPALAAQINSIVSQPVGKLFYDPAKDDIINDEAYASSMQTALSNLKRLQDEAMKKAEAENAKYKDALARGDASMIKRDWATAKAAYTEASAIKTFEQYPKDKIAECDKEIAATASDAEKEAKYKAAIAKGDAAMTAKDYTNAKAAYNEAVALKQNEPYPRAKLLEIDKLLGEQAKAGEMEAKYKAALAKGDAALGAKDYTTAKAAYYEALGIKAKEKYPTDKIAEIDKILADLAAQAKADKALNEKYNGLIAKADKSLSDKFYMDAKTGYTAALALKPNEQYPKDKLAEVEKLLEKDANQKALEEKYQAAIVKGDKALAAKTYAEAKTAYTEALSYKPNEQYPKDKLAEVDALLAKDAAAKQLEENYKATLAKADAALAAKDLKAAKTGYTDALGMKPNEKYPKDKLAEVDKLLAAEMGAKELTEKYNAAIAKADAALAAKDYTAAKGSYNDALGFKPAEAYPKDKLAEINKILADQAAEKDRNEKYAASIAKGDKLLADKKYTDAKAAYTDAATLKPNEQYPKDKLAEIDAALAKLQSDKQLEENYKAALAKGDKALTTKDYTAAKGAYTDAAGLKPNEQLPKDKIAEVDKLIAAEMNAKQLEENYKAAITKADAALAAKDLKAAKAGYTEALGLKPNEKYPKDKLAEVDKLLAAEMGAKELTEKYNAAIAKADAALAAKDYTAAKGSYNDALGFKPAEAYPKDKLAEINKILADQAAEKDRNEKYAASIAKGDKLLADKKYTDAKAAYTDAATLKPNEQYPKDKLAEIDAALAKLQSDKQLEENYKAALAKGDKALTTKDYTAAKGAYTDAAGLKPNEQLPKDKIAEVDKLIAAEMNAKQLEENYKAAITKADAALAAKDLKAAKAGYTEALGLKPNEKYPKDKLAEVDKLLAAEMGAKELTEKYNAAIAKADAALAAKDYTGAKGNYNDALGFKPAEAYPKDKLAEINKILADMAAEKDRNEKYAAAIAKADVALGAKSYAAAKGSYSEALGLKPNEQYPKDKISEIDAILAKQLSDKQLQDNYNNAIAKADKALAAKDYATAKSGYTDALGLKPTEQYPKDKLAEVDKLLSAEMSAKQLEENYKAAIGRGDAALASKDYTAAKAGYNEALGLKPNEKYPKDKLAEVDKLIAAEMGAKELAEKYNAAIAKADGAMGAKDYTTAKASYNDALGFKPVEAYPKDKIAEINKILGDLAAEKDRNEKYTAAIAKADAALALKSYGAAKGSYSEALGLKPNEQYPKDKISEIDAILAKQLSDKQLQDNYNNAIAKADKAMTVKDYATAKAGYTDALGLKPNEQYPKDKLAEVEALMAKAQQEKEINDRYIAAIAKADGFFTAQEYQNAKAEYNNALGIKATEQYPKNRIAEIERLLLAIAAKEKAEKELTEKYNAMIAKADNAFGAKAYPEAKGYYNQALAMKPAEQYPKDKIAEIDALVAKELKDRKNGELYKSAIARGDAALSTKDYINAKADYSAAAGYKPDEQYPKTKLAEIDAILDKEQKARQLEEDYKKAIVNGDMNFGAKDYEGAKTAYTQASNLKPNDKYPKEQLVKVEKLISDLNREKQLKEKYAAAITKADDAFMSKDYTNAIASYKEAQTYRPIEMYPTTRLADIQRIIDDQARVKERDTKYNTALAIADKLYNAKDYQKARGAYSDALLIKSSEQYPKERMAAIDELLRKTNKTVVSAPVVKREENKNDLAQKYPEGLTEEYATELNASLVKRIVVKGNEGHLYIQKTTKFGPIYWTRDGVPITEVEYIKNTEQ